MNHRLFSLLVIVLALSGLTACQSLSDRQTNSQAAVAANPQEPIVAAPAIPNNLVALFLVKKDNLNNQLRGEVYPIALYINNSYVDVSRDVTPQIRDDFQEDILVRNTQPQSLLSAIKTFTVLNQTDKVGEFKVNKLRVSQFACSAFLTGQGKFVGDKSLQSVFDSIPSDHAGGFKGSMAGKEFDETWRWTIATSQFNPPPAEKPPLPAEVDKYKPDVLKLAKTVIALEPSQKLPVNQPIVIEAIKIFDLNHDGQPEVFGQVRQGRDPKSLTTEAARRVDRSQVSTFYANIWLTYKDGRPQVIASQVLPYEFPVTRTPYNVVGTLDVNGDGIEEVMVRNNGYESTSFGIYQYQNQQLKAVFNGAGYGC
ncbi:hypothetical protein [Pantanalinema sp. GBBB05]|uniref:hypothetical protein n=1 Tax=Pantanalinema sp. GBBB05 TaxID=2604139 RepID=UPI001D5C204B|nr:hypothetical protein [Pantanalinema sp. GBBB05]